MVGHQPVVPLQAASVASSTGSSIPSIPGLPVVSVGWCVEVGVAAGACPSGGRELERRVREPRRVRRVPARGAGRRIDGSVDRQPAAICVGAFVACHSRGVHRAHGGGSDLVVLWFLAGGGTDRAIKLLTAGGVLLPAAGIAPQSARAVDLSAWLCNVGRAGACISVLSADNKRGRHALWVVLSLARRVR